jgi:hypothetical protein
MGMTRRQLLLAAPCAAAVTLNGKSLVDPVNKDGNGAAVEGYDVVAYFDQGRPAMGSPAFSHSWMGATWRFASQQSRDRFAADPARYAPQYGGYCSWAVSQGYTAKIDPEAWKIVNGKLYLNYNKKVQQKWERDAPALIEKANRNWPNLHK